MMHTFFFKRSKFNRTCQNDENKLNTHLNYSVVKYLYNENLIQDSKSPNKFFLIKYHIKKVDHNSINIYTKV